MQNNIHVFKLGHLMVSLSRRLNLVYSIDDNLNIFLSRMIRNICTRSRPEDVRIAIRKLIEAIGGQTVQIASNSTF